MSLFLCLRENLVEACRTRGRVLQSRPDPPGRRTAPEFSNRETHAGETYSSYATPPPPEVSGHMVQILMFLGRLLLDP